MKKHLLLATAVLSVAFPLFALRPGDAAEELTGVRWMQGTKLSPLAPARTSPDDPQYKAVVFLLTRAPNSQEVLTMLTQLQRAFAGKLRMAIVTPDSENDVKNLLAGRPDVTLPFGSDTKREVTSRYMAGSMLFPKAFLFDNQGKIIWSGEAVDLGEVVEEGLKGKYNFSVQPRIAPLLDELETMLRDSNERKMKQLVDSILTLQPGQPTALRIRLFLLEANGRAGEAWTLMQSQLKALPSNPRLHIMALDLACRNAELGPNAAAAARDYFGAVTGNPDADNQIAWMLLTRRTDDAEALKAARALVLRAEAVMPQQDGALRGTILNSRALYEYRIGNLDAAIDYQIKAEEVFRKAELRPGALDAQRKLLYYRTAKELQGKK